MKGNAGHISFCPLWSKDDSSSFLPSGLRCIWHPSSKEESVAWNTRRTYLNRNSTKTYKKTYSCGGINRSWTMNQPEGFKFASMYNGCSAFTEPVSVSYNGTTVLDRYVHNMGTGYHDYDCKSASRPHIVYLSEGYTGYACGIVPALESSSMGKKSTATAVFGAILTVPSGWTSAVVHTFYFDNWLGRKFNFNLNEKAITGRTQGEYIGPSGWMENGQSPYQLTYYVTGKMNTKTQAWPDDNNIFTGVKYLGSKGENYLFFHQMTATITSGHIMTPAFYCIQNGSTFKDPVVYDQWVGIKV